MNALSLDELRARHLPAIESMIVDVASEVCPADSPLLPMLRYHLASGGKRLRAIIPLAVAEALGEPPQRVVPLGAACEVLHNATLVHDDLQDGDTHRRGRETVWHRFGAARAVDLGDAMVFLALELIERLDGSATRRGATRRRLLAEMWRVIDGQEQDFALRNLARPSMEAYFRMVEGKTSGLFALPMAGAALACNARGELVDGFAEAARHLGALFQIQDDILDIWADKGREARGSDIREGKRSLLVVHCLRNAEREVADELRELLDRPRAETTADDVARATQLFLNVGSLDFAIDEIERRARAARDVAAFRGNAELVGLVDELCGRFLTPIEDVMRWRGPPPVLTGRRVDGAGRCPGGA